MASYDGVPRGGPQIQASADTFSARGLRVAIVGGTGGIGRAIARLLVEGGAQVTVVGRTFRDPGVVGLDFIRADLESVAEARRVAASLPAEDLDALVLTTGIVTAPHRETTAEGFERDMAISYLSRFVLVRALGERLGSRRPRRPRLFVMGFPGVGEQGDPDDLNAEKAYLQWPQHLNTVAANEALVLDAASRFPRLAVFGLNPGLMATDIRANMYGGTRPWRFRIDDQTGFHLNKQGVPITPSAAMTPERVAAFTTATESLIARLAA